MNFELFFRGSKFTDDLHPRNRMQPKAFCWSHLGCIRTKFLKSWFHVIDDYRLKYFSSAGLPWSPASNSLTHHECSQLTSASRIKVRRLLAAFCSYRVQIVCELEPSKKKLKIHPLATLLQSIMLVSWQWMCEAPRFVVCCVCIRLLVSNVHEQHLKALGYYAPCLFLASWKLHDLFQFFNCSWQKNDEKIELEVREISQIKKSQPN